MREIRGNARTIRELLGGRKYAVDYYQREYKWQTKQVVELLDDLSKKFLDDFKAEDERAAVASYGHYFLGSIIVSQKQDQNFVIDGQQRLTTLSLLLIYLHNLQRERPDRVKVEELIFSEKFSKKSFNLDVDERTAAMEALFNQQPFDPSDRSESVRNIIGRYRDIEDHFPEEVRAEALPYFVDWLIENVHLVEITAYSDEDAYTIFETMNDRGLSLTPADMLKGYILANITDDDKKLDASRIWKSRLGALVELGKDEDADSLKSWLRSQYAETIRERRKGAAAGDFDRLGTEFHRWVREHDEKINLGRSDDYFRFVDRDLNFYTRTYLRLRQAAKTYTPGLEVVFFNAQQEFTLQYPLLLAPLTPEDSEAVVDQKVRMVGTAINILLARRLWNFKLIAYSTMQYAMFVVMREIRHKTPPELVDALKKTLAAEQHTFASNPRLRVHQQNRNAIHQILARLTDFIERQSGQPSRFTEYVSEGKNRYEVEHIWANHAERFVDEFPTAADFDEYRNRIGGLLLLPKSFNGSYGDLPYENKLPHYFGQNLLAKSLHPNCYERNPGFLAFRDRSGLPFRPHPEFKKEDLDARHDLYRQIAEQVWNPELLDRELGQT
jgi:Protein of unknown function DUF262/Protein of unknown function (DUF1524)